MKKIRNKILFTMMLLTLLPLLLIGGYSFYTTSEALRENALKEQQSQLEEARRVLNGYLSGAERDLVAIRDSKAIQQYLSEDKSSLTNILSLFEFVTQQQKIYSSVSFLDVLGQEVIRVEKQKNSVNSITKADDLLDQSKSAYFTEVSRLAVNKVYISPLELMRVDNEIVVPHKSIMRFASTVSDSNNRVQGVLVLNIDADVLMEYIVPDSKNSKSRLFADPNGYLYFHDDVSKRWGGPNDLAHNTSIFTDASFGLSSIQSSDELQPIENATNVGLSVPVVLGKDRGLLGYLVNVAPKSLVFKPLQDYLHISLIIVAICLLLSFLFAIILSNSLSDPLVRLTEKVKSFSQGDLDTPIGLGTKNEIGDLSQAMELLRKSMVILMKRSRKV